MPVAFVNNLGPVTSATSGTSLTLSGVNLAIGDVLLIWVVFDNSGTGTPTVSTIGKPAGETNTWAKVAEFNSPLSGGGAASRGELWWIKASVAWSSASAGITLSSSVTAKVAVGKRFSGVGGFVAASNRSASSSAGTLSTITPDTSGALWVVGGAWENNALPATPFGGTSAAYGDIVQGNTASGGAAANQAAAFGHRLAAPTGTVRTESAGTEYGIVSASFSEAAGGNQAAAGVVSAVSTVALAVTSRLGVAGVVPVVSLASCSAAVRRDTSGVVAAVSTSSIAALRVVPTAGVAAGSSTASLEATVSRATSGTVPAVSASSLEASARIGAAGVVEVSSTVSMAVTVRRAVSGVVSAASGVVLAATRSVPAAGVVAAVSGASLVLSGTNTAAGVVVATSSSSLAVSVRRAVAGVVPVVSAGQLTVSAARAVAGVVPVVSGSSVTVTVSRSIGGAGPVPYGSDEASRVDVVSTVSLDVVALLSVAGTVEVVSGASLVLLEAAPTGPLSDPDVGVLVGSAVIGGLLEVSSRSVGLTVGDDPMSPTRYIL